MQTPEPEYELPPITTTGANTFGCYVNGRLWLPGRNKRVYSISITSDYDNGYLSVAARRKDFEIEENDPLAIFSSLGFHIQQGAHLSNEHLLGSRKSKSYGLFADYSDIHCTNYETDSIASSGKIEILRLDSSKAIVSGTFELTLIADGCDTVEITDGRFDIQYKY